MFPFPLVYVGDNVYVGWDGSEETFLPVELILRVY